MASYVMDSQEENQRLQAQARADSVSARLVRTGLARGMRALDLGCGPGVTSLDMANVVGSEGAVVGLDRSAERLAEARRTAAAASNVSFVEGDAFRLPFPDAHFDYAWSQFVFEYFADRSGPLRELLRVTKPGGCVAICDVDNSGFLNWPFPAELQHGLGLVQSALEKTGFDPYVGRKLYSEMRAAGFTSLRVHVEPHYVHAGAADARSVSDWETRFRALEGLVAPSFGGVEAYRKFAGAFVDYWAAPDALKYSVLLITEGRRP